MSKTIENFLRYVKIDTQSCETSGVTPSTEKQHKLAELLTEELKAMGAAEITYDREHCYVYATVPAAPGCEEAPVLGFIAHMDTSPAVTDTNVKPRIVENYDGKDIVLNHAENIVFRTEDFPEVLKLTGKDLIVTDGTTLLGADDKAGIAEIMAMAEYLLTHPELPHGKSASALRRMRKSGRERTILTWRFSARILPIPWTAESWESWRTKPSTPRRED